MAKYRYNNPAIGVSDRVMVDSILAIANELADLNAKLDVLLGLKTLNEAKNSQ